MRTAPASLAVVPPLPSTLPLEQVIGEITAGAALAIARALNEFQNSSLSSSTRTQGGDLVARLVELWLACADKVHFYAVARARGAQLLQERYGKDVNARTIDILVDGVLEVLHEVARSQLN
jgi:hypothetical protein